MMKKVIRITTFSLLFVLFAGYSVSLFAQTQDQQTVLADNTEQTTSKTKKKKSKQKMKNQKAEEKTLLIEVTSNKRKENIQDVPASVSAFTGVELEDRKIQTPVDIATLVPNYTASSMGTFSFHSIRGQSNLIQYSTPIGIYVDDVPLSTVAGANWGIGADPSLFAIERVEVLRGAQGNLYGSNSAGGVINIITHKPQNYWEGKATAGFGNYDSRDFKASVGGPVVKDKLYAQVSGMYKKQNAFIHQIGESPLLQNQGGMRFRLTYTPLQNLELSLASQINHLNTNVGGMVNKTTIDNNNYDMFTLPSGLGETNDKCLANLNSLQIKYTHDVFEMNSITSFNYSTFSQKADMGLWGMTGVYGDYGTKISTWTQEIRFVSVQDSPLKWLAGMFYANSKSKADMKTGTTKENLNQDLNDFSLFSNISYTFIKKITLGFGLRYDLDHKKLDYDKAVMGTTTTDIDTKNTTHSVSPKFTFDYKVHPTSLLYVSVARGVKNGMYSEHPVNVETSFVKPEYAWTYEGGLKTNFYNNRIFFNINGFYTQMTDVQVFYFDATGNKIFKNAGKAHSAGTELEFTAKPVRGLDISLTAGYLFSAFTKHITAAYTGNALPFAPVYQVGFWTQYTSPIGIYLGFGLNVNGKTYFGDDNKMFQKDYITMRGKVGYMSNHFSIDLWMENIANQEYWAYLIAYGPQTAAVPGSPRTFGMSVSGYF